MEISGLPRGFSTCCLRFTSGVATTHAKLASGWLARLYREGVEPSGPLQKVSDHILVPPFLDLSWRKKGLPSSLVQLRTAIWTGDARDTRPGPDMAEGWSDRRYCADSNRTSDSDCASHHQEEATRWVAPRVDPRLQACRYPFLILLHH